MMERVDARLDGTTLVVRIPMRFQRRGGRKRIVAPDGSQIVPTSKPQADGTLAKALAPAWRWQRMLDDGVCASVSEIGDVENISKSYVSRILRLALLAPDLVEKILEGRTNQALMLERLERPLPASWEEQHELLQPGGARPTGSGRALREVSPMAGGRNVLGQEAETCFVRPMSRFHRAGAATPLGALVVCAEGTAEFLAFSEAWSIPLPCRCSWGSTSP